jgi:hypothetical protein
LRSSPENSQVVELEQAGPAQVQGFLKQAVYPLSNEQLLATARAAGATPEVLLALEQLPAREYGSQAEVSDALGELQFGLAMDRDHVDEDEHGLVIGPEDAGGDLEDV